MVTGSWAGEQFDLVTENKNQDRVAIEGWFSLDAARALFERAKLDLAAEIEKAKSADFRPVALGSKLRANIKNVLRTVESKNVVARLEGTEAADEVVLYMAHWDHLGTQEGEGDTIFNGASDNATGTAGLLEIARAFSSSRSEAAPLGGLSRGDRRGAGTSRFPLLRAGPALPPCEDRRRDQYGRTQRVGAHAET